MNDTLFHISIRTIQKTAWVFFGVGCISIANIILTSAMRPEPTPMSCNSEDEVLVEMVEDAFDMNAGSVYCVHVDSVVRRNYRA